MGIRLHVQNPEPPARRLLIGLLLAGLLLAGCEPAQTRDLTIYPPDIPRPRTQDTWKQRHQEQLSDPARAGATLVVLGDSILEGWYRSQSFQEHFGHYPSLNLAIGGDQTHNVLWRIENGALNNLDPQLVILMIGVNNLGRGLPPARAVQGILAVLNQVHKRLPNTQILLLSVMPAAQHPDNPFRDRIQLTNKLLATETLPDRVTLLDLGSHFLEDDGTISPKIMADFLHPTPEGNNRLSRGLAEHVHGVLGGGEGGH